MDEVAVTREAIIVREHADVVARLGLHALDGRRLRELEPPVFGSVVALAYDLRADMPYAALASHVAPPSLSALAPPVVRLEAGLAGRRALRRFDARVETRLRAREGRREDPGVHRPPQGRQLDGGNPTLLSGYGGFNIAVEPYYVGGWYPFLSRGGVFVEAGVRGGSEYGETWHEQAMFARKQNTFDDMVAVAEWLVAEKYTRPAKLAVEGGSNGGLTVGALLTQRPDLFRAAICQVPLLDMVRFHKFLIARYWIAEYGDPDRAADFRWILRYSPYQNVRLGVNLPETLGGGGRVRLARRSAAREEVRRCRAEQPRPGVAVPAVHGLRQRPRHGQDAAAARRRSRLRAALRDERARHERCRRRPGAAK